MTRPAPGLFSIPRITTLLASLLVALGSGTNYVYSAYAPQLGSRLQLTHTQLNFIALGGNMGVYGTGPIWGRIADSRGPRYLLPSAFGLLLVGYSGIWRLYDSGSPGSLAIFYALIVFSFMTGAGGNAGLAGAINTTAKSFPDRTRATSTAVVISGFGLSAFFFSVIAHAAFADNISAFLLLLALGTSLPMVVGFFFVRVIPLPKSDLTHGLEYGAEVPASAEGDGSVAFLNVHDSQMPLLSNVDSEEQPTDSLAHEDSTDYRDPQNRGSLELSPARSNSPGRRRAGRNYSVDSATGKPIDHLPNLHGKTLWTSGNFWLLCSILTLLSGTGLMYINNVGSMSLALSAKGNPSYDKTKAAKWQAAQVSTLSFMNFSGRIFIGLTSDFSKNYLGFPRSYCLSLVALLFIASQVLTATIDDIRNLWKATALVGLAYGSIFGLFPTMAIEWFGLSHFSENWGYLSLSPMVGSNILSLAFGMNLDAHAPPKHNDTSDLPQVLSADRQCLQGRACYIDSLYITLVACVLALLLSLWAGWKDRRKLEVAASKRTRSASVVWEEDRP